MELYRNPINECCRFARLLLDKYRHSNDCDEQLSKDAIAQLHKAVELCNGKASTAIAEIFVDVHLERLFRIGLKEDADIAESYVRTILKERPLDCFYLSKLLAILHIRYQRTGCCRYISESIELAETAIVNTESDDPHLPMLLGACGVALLDFSEKETSTSALYMAVDVLRTSCERLSSSATKEWVFVRKTLAEALRRRFEVTGREDDIVEARAIFDRDDCNADLLPREVLECLMTRMRVVHSQWRLSPNGVALNSLIQDYAELNTILKFNERSPILAELFQATGRAFNESFFMPGQRKGLAFTTIKSGFQAAKQLLSSWSEIPGRETEALAPYLFELGKAYELQFDWYYSPAALKEACKIFIRCCQLTSSGSAHYSLRAAAMIKTQRMANQLSTTHDDSIEKLVTQTLVTALVKGFPMDQRSKAALATELGYTAVGLHQRCQNRLYLDRAVEHFKKAVDFCCTDNLSLAFALQQLSEILCKRGDCLRQFPEMAMQDYEDAINALNTLDALCKEKGFNLQDSKDTLGDICAKQYRLSCNDAFANQAIESWRQLFQGQNGIPIARLAAALKAADLQQQISVDHEKAASVLADVVKTLLEVLSDSDTRSEQMWKLRKFAPITMHAASEAILAGRPPKDVVQLLERGRSMIWNRLLNRKVNVENLKKKHHHLAERFLSLRKLLFQPQTDKGDGGRQQSFQQELESNRYHLADEYSKVIARIRNLPGFEDFMLPDYSPEELQQQAAQGPIIIFVQSNACHAIIVTSEGIFTKALLHFDRMHCEKYYEQFKEFLNLRESNPDEASKKIEDVLSWMWHAAAGPVISLIMEKLELAPLGRRPDKLPRVWWVCSGWINVLPIHAAGDHKRALESGEPCTVMDMVISSYTPTLRALDYSRKTMYRMISMSSSERPIAALVSMEKTPDKKPDLLNAPAEVREVEAILKSYYDVVTMGRPLGNFRAHPRRQTVASALHTCTIAHFACHGGVNETDPLESRLLLADWAPTPLKVGFLMRMDFERCQLVNLSACNMAVNRDRQLREEGLHMSGAFQMAGVPHAIATMWPILDAYSVRVSKDFYNKLKLPNGSVDVANAAACLRYVTVTMRNERLSPLVWGAYVHFGA